MELLEAQGCICKVVQWPALQGKGLDDLIAHQGPKAYEKAIAAAQSADQEKSIYYRSVYRAIARQVREDKGEIPQQRLDMEVYLKAIERNGKADAARFASESDEVRRLRQENPQFARDYVKGLEKLAPIYLRMLQQQRPEEELEQFIVQAVKLQSVASVRTYGSLGRGLSL